MDTNMSIFPLFDSEHNAKEDTKWLKENLHYENFDEIVRKWKMTGIHRLKCLEEDHRKNKTALKLFRNWPHYKLPRGPQLILIDYDMKFQESKENLYTRYEEVFVPFMINHCFPSDLLDPSLAKTFNELTALKDEMSKDAINALVMYLLHGYIKPTRKGEEEEDNIENSEDEIPKTKGRGRKKNTNKSKQNPKQIAIIAEASANSQSNQQVDKSTSNKFGIADSIESMIKVRTNISATVPKKKLEQTFILCIGEDIYHLRDFYIVMEETKYIATSFLHALEVTFKIFNLFNFGYPTESINIWTFIQKFFFDIHYSKHDFVNTTVGSLMKKLTLFEKDLKTIEMEALDEALL
ncbi:hypothetical protein ACFFRR_003922 [Megaselia abdita]